MPRALRLLNLTAPFWVALTSRFVFTQNRQPLPPFTLVAMVASFAFAALVIFGGGMGTAQELRQDMALQDRLWSKQKSGRTRRTIARSWRRGCCGSSAAEGNGSGRG